MRRTYPKKRASELMERGQRMQQRQGQGIRCIEHLYCGITCPCLEKHKELVLEQALITPKLILKRVFGKDTGMRTLLGTMQEGIEEMESLVNIDYSPVTINRYKNVVKKLRQLIPSYYGKEDITFHELTPEFIRAFDIYLKTEGACAGTR